LQKTVFEQQKAEQEQIGMMQYVAENEAKDEPAHYRGKHKQGTTWKLVKDQLHPYWVHQNFEPGYWGILERNPGKWFHVPIGQPRDDAAPEHLITKVPCVYQQDEKSFCLVYSLASALYYMGLDKEANKMSDVADSATELDLKDALDAATAYMSEHAPCIAGYQSFGAFCLRKKHELSMKQLCVEKTPYPNIVVPLGKDQSLNHAVCVVDDLIFDSTQKYALKLKRKSLDWVCGGDGAHSIHGARRFQYPMGQNEFRLKRWIRTNWK